MATHSKNVTIDAVQYTGKYAELPEDYRQDIEPEHGTTNCIVPTATGSKLCRPTDYIVRNQTTTGYQVVKEADFEAVFPKTTAPNG